jgi:colicin import membrane protein
MGLASCLLSLLLHLSVIVLALVGPWWGGEMRMDLDQPVYEVEVVRMPEQKKAVQVPDTSRQKPKAQQKTPKQVKTRPKAQAKPRPAPSKPSRAEPVQIAKKEAKPQAAKVREKERPRPSKRPQAAAETQAKTPERVMQEALKDVSAQAEQESAEETDDLKNVLAQLKQDAAAQGVDTGNLGRSASAGGTEKVYGALVRNRIQANWRFPDLGQDKDLTATVRIRIDAQGTILDQFMQEPSGNAQFDSSVLRAIARTGQLQPPPNPDLRTVRITFHLQDMMP